MSLIEVFIIGVGLSMDAFAASICKGLSYKEASLKKALIPGAYFGIFQALMPALGFVIGGMFKNAIEAYDHWVAFVLLAFIGGGMIREAGKEPEEDSQLGLKAMLPLAVATSIDALTVGVGFGVLNVNIGLAVCIIGLTTFVLSAIGFKVGSIFGSKYKAGAEIAGGIILILIGLKILLEHTGIISF